MARLAFRIVMSLHFLTSVTVGTAGEIVVLTLLAHPSAIRELESVLIFFFHWFHHFGSLFRLALLTR
jgi:hypothetical protein